MYTLVSIENVDEILVELRESGAYDIKYTVGTRGIHIDFKTTVDEVTQYSYIKFDE